MTVRSCPEGSKVKWGVLKGGNWISEFGDHYGAGSASCSSASLSASPSSPKGGPSGSGNPLPRLGLLENSHPQQSSALGPAWVWGLHCLTLQEGSSETCMYSTAVRAPNWPGCSCHHADLLPPPPHLPEFLWGFQGSSQGSSCTGVLVRAAFGGPSTKQERLVVLVFTGDCGCHPQGLWSPGMSQRHILGPHPDLLSQKLMDGPSQSPR